VIIDEAQKLSNNTSIRYKTIYDFLRKSNPKAIFLLTGTPLTNRPINLYHILKLIDADITRDYNYFVKRYCGGTEIHLKDGRTIIKSGDATNLDELRERIKDIYIRRLASETGEMVEKTVLRKYYDLDDKQKTEYDRLWNEYQTAQENVGKYDTEQYRQLVEGMLVRQYLAKEMTAHTIDLVDEYLSENEKVVIITCFQEEMDKFQKHYGKKCVVYNGKMTTKQKDKAQDEFLNNPKVMVFVGQIEACGTGLSLPVSKTIVFNSYSWSSTSNKQAEDRVYRLTQTRDVECIYQLFTDSISQDMFDKVIYKELIANQTIKSEKEKNELK
jgi:SNF2 family DNA or RNA helicase